jgi:fructose-1,6-bisphosphatase/inositol monophosphatase family enzyme
MFRRGGAAMTVSLPDPGAIGRILRAVAATEILPRFRNLAASDIRHKKRNPRDLVTTADVEAERALEAQLESLLPGAAFVGEEAAEARPEVLASLAGADPVWLLDPVDGTGNFAAGEPCFAVIVALQAAGETRIGLILDPIADVLLWAVAGGGAWQERGGDRTRVRIVANQPREALRGSLTHRAATRLGEAMAARGESALPACTRYGSAGREYMDLATGALDFASYTRLKPWDHAAGVLIHREAGGYSALRSNGSPYRVQPRIVEDTLLVAPDENAWRCLHARLG